jgi:predicted transcriptional regulator
MRTTLTLDKDVAAMVERLRKARRQSMKTLINDALREGLKSLTAPNRRRVDFETDSVDLGRCLVRNVDDIAETIAGAENESFR